MEKTVAEKKNGVAASAAASAAAQADAVEPLMVVEPSNLSAEQLAELKEQAAKANEHWERLLRTTADFENFKKRSVREKQDALKFANEGTLPKLIPATDNFDMALAAVQNGQVEGMKSLQAGISMIHQQLKAVLVEAGLEE